MKNYTAILAAVAALALCSTAKAITYPISETDTLMGSGGYNVTVVSTVNLSGSLYTYSYQATASGTAGGDYTGFTVYFNTTLASLASITPGNTSGPPSITVNTSTIDINWNYGGTGAAQTGPDTYSFTSTFPPGQGFGGAADTTSYGGNFGANQSGRVYVPNVPDGGLTVALLGGALVGLQMLRRKLAA